MSAPIVFFDGRCGLCNRFVDFLLKRDLGEKMLFAPLQGTTAKKLLSEKERQLDSVVLWEESGTSKKSKAALRILSYLGGAWALAGIFWLVPPLVRDAVYDLVARNRYRWFGQRELCRIPSAAERARFLD